MEFLASEMEISQLMIDQQNSKMEKFASNLRSVMEELKRIQNNHYNERVELKNLIQSLQQTIGANFSRFSSPVNWPLLQSHLLKINPPKEGSIMCAPSNLMFGHFNSNPQNIPHINDRSDDNRQTSYDPTFPPSLTRICTDGCIGWSGCWITST